MNFATILAALIPFKMHTLRARPPGSNNRGPDKAHGKGPKIPGQMRDGRPLPPRTKIMLGAGGKPVYKEPKYVNGEHLTYAN